MSESRLEKEKYRKIKGRSSVLEVLSGLDQEKTPLRSKYGFSVGQVRGCEERGQTTAISGARGDVRDSNFEFRNLI
jgi:hypothetical protein